MIAASCVLPFVVLLSPHRQHYLLLLRLRPGGTSWGSVDTWELPDLRHSKRCVSRSDLVFRLTSVSDLVCFSRFDFSRISSSRKLFEVLYSYRIFWFYLWCIHRFYCTYTVCPRFSDLPFCFNRIRPPFCDKISSISHMFNVFRAGIAVVNVFFICTNVVFKLIGSYL